MAKMISCRLTKIDSRYLYRFGHFAFQLHGHKVLENKTPTKLLSFCFVLICSHKVSVMVKDKDIMVKSLLFSYYSNNP